MGFWRRVKVMAVAALAVALAGSAGAGPEHGIAMFGAPALPPDFAHLPYADPDAPKGGAIAFGEVGGFDSLNPFVLKGRAPGEVRTLTVESLLGRSWDEPFALYGLLAETVETPLNRAWVAFALRPEARFSDGAQVTVDDVLWSMETLAEKGRPGFRAVWSKVTQVERTGPLSFKLHLDGADREAPLVLGLAPVFRKAQWEGRDFAESGLEPIIGSGPYVVESFDPGRTVVFRRDEVYWGRHLAFNKGRANFDEVRVEYFRDAAAHFDAFKAGIVTFFRETDPTRWRDGYAFAAAEDGKVRRSEVPHQRPTGMYGFVFNTRRPIFADIRVRRALLLAFNFEWINDTLFSGSYKRITSYFANSPLAHRGVAEGREREILAPFADVLPVRTLDAPWEPPVADPGDPRNRRALREAGRLLEAAGWTVRDGALRDAAGAPFAFELLLNASSDERVAGVFRDALATLGIAASIRLVDNAQYSARRDAYDFDMIVNRWGLSLSPGAEQRLYWGSAGATEPGSRNYMGVASPAIDAAIEALVSARRQEDLEAAARALDRALSHGVYVIPFWHTPVSRIASDRALRYPSRLPLYGDWIGWAPDVWWREPEGGAPAQ